MSQPMNPQDVQQLCVGMMSQFEDKLKKVQAAAAAEEPGAPGGGGGAGRPAPPLADTPIPTRALSLSLDGLANEFYAFKSTILSMLTALQDHLREVDHRVDHLEAITKKNTLMLHGVPESPDENTKAVAVKTFKERLTVTLETSAIYSSFRLGKAKPADGGAGGGDARPRPIIINFDSSEARSAVWTSKAKLKGSGLLLTEALTRKRQELYAKVRESFDVGCRWTNDGVIYVLLRDGARRRIHSPEDLQEAMKLNSSGPAAAPLPKPPGPRRQPPRSGKGAISHRT